VVLEALILAGARPATSPMIVCSAAIRDLHAHEGMLQQYGIAILPKPFDIARFYTEVERALAGGK
jgi:hypothetical protein